MFQMRGCLDRNTGTRARLHWLSINDNIFAASALDIRAEHASAVEIDGHQALG